MNGLPQSSPRLRRLPAFTVGFLCCVVSIGTAQSRLRATSATGFFKDPNGIRLATLQDGIAYRAGRTNAGWVEVTIEGYLWAKSTEPTNREGFDLIVTANGGEVLRASPNGTVVARLQEGTLLTKVATKGAWIQVTRTAWATRSGFTDPNPPKQVAKAAPSPAPAPPPAAAVAESTHVVSSGDSTPPQTAPTPGPELEPGTGGERATVRQGAELATLPDGARMAVLGDGGSVEVLGRSHDWVKVRIEGWIRQSDIAAMAASGPQITGAMLREDPAKYVGQSVDWRLNFLALEKADELRPEMPLGQPYLLTRGPLPEAGFVYVLLKPDQLNDARGLRPLDEIRVQGIIRAGRTRYLPTPVVELTRLVER
jgi:hypothetical protein